MADESLQLTGNGEDCRVDENDRTGRFEDVVLPHLDAAYNLARWLTGSEHDAEDIVQDACVRAFKYLGGFRGGDSRAWLLTIVRNTAYTWLKRTRKWESTVPLEEELHPIEDPGPHPDAAMLRKADAGAVRQAIEQLQPEFREAIVLRELEGLSYKEIADVARVPVGTVMSRLARARRQLQQALTGRQTDGGVA